MEEEEEEDSASTNDEDDVVMDGEDGEDGVDDGVDDGCLCEDSEDESPLPSVSLISALISIGLIAILRRK